MQRYLAALGANKPTSGLDVASAVLSSIDALGARYRLSVQQRSDLFETAAWPAGSGPNYINAAVEIETDLAPAQVLEIFHEVEDQFGRKREVRWGPRTLDLDLLSQEDVILPDRTTAMTWLAKKPTCGTVPAPDRLVLPHPRLHERPFVLAPLCDIRPSWNHPILQKTVAQLWDDLPAEQQASVRRIG